jgi:hypothetical protein
MHQAAAAKMHVWEQIFSRENILKELCRLRLRTFPRGKARRFGTRSCQRAPSVLDRAFPPRKSWHRFRPGKRRGIARADHRQDVLLRAVRVLAEEQPTAAWAVELDKVVRSIQRRALLDPAFAFAQPRVVPVPKKGPSDVFRPICIFDVEDSVISSLTARYLRSLFNPVFAPSSLAFRAGRPGLTSPDRNRGIERLMEVRHRYADQALFVAELDLLGFYDCLDHEVVARCLRDLTAEAMRRDPTFTVAARALEIVRAYLDCFSFPDQIKGAAEAALQKRNPTARFAWAEDELELIHGNPRGGRIGVPQGGAISVFLANAVLHFVDRAVEQLHGGREVLTYLRFCDDLIIVARSREVCSTALETCLTALKRLRLPVHEPTAVGNYGREHWKSKSKCVYSWCRPQQPGDVPWIQFLGYQVRYDGAVRVSPSSIRKQRDRVCAETDAELNRIRRDLARARDGSYPGTFNGMTATELLHRLRRRLVKLAVGWRRAPWSKAKPTPCWANGFRSLVGRNLITTSLRSLDRYRERQVRRVKRALIRHGLMAETSSKRRPYWGHPTSYAGQFRR